MSWRLSDFQFRGFGKKSLYMPSPTNPSMSRRRQCVYQLHHSVKATGSSTMDAEMAESLGIFINSNDGAVSHPLPTLPSSSKDVTTVFWESYEVACYLDELMDESTKFLGWSYVNHLSTHSNSTGYPSLITSGLEIAIVFWKPYWGCSTIRTNIDQAEALVFTVHSR